MDSENSGCFTWCIRLKKSSNERWARFRNSFRRRFYDRRRQSVELLTLQNEAGTHATVISKKRCKVVPYDMALKATATGVLTGGMEKTDPGHLDRLVKGYVSGVIKNAADIVRSETRPTFQDTQVTSVQCADDNVSVSSRPLNQKADNIVTESLTNIVLETGIYQSAQNGLRPRTTDELENLFGIADADAIGDGQSLVSE